jgi:predicted transposase/invertase (TIGR01784 family)
MIKPTEDLAFKKVLASEENKDILAGFIKDFFDIVPEQIVIKNPYSIESYMELLEKNDVRKLRQTLKDIGAEITGADFYAEMQVHRSRYFDVRSLYYPFSAFCSHFNEPRQAGEPKKVSPYRGLKPIYTLNVLDYIRFKDDDDALRVFELYDPVRQKSMPTSYIKVGYFELTKGNIETKNQQYWSDYFLERPLSEDAPEYIKKAKTVIDYSNFSQEERKMVDLAEKAFATYFDELEGARDEGEEIGKEIGKDERTQEILDMIHKGYTIDAIEKALMA